MPQIRIHGGNLKAASEKYQIPEADFIDFSANINPLGPPAQVYQTIKDNLAQITQYPDSRYLALKAVLSDHLQAPVENLLLGNGASELIFLIVNFLRPKRVWLPVPTFSEYEIASRAAGAEIRRISLSGEAFNQLNTNELSDLQAGDLLFICNPNNPTGQLYDQDLLKYLLKKTNNCGAYLVVDESFLDFLVDSPKITVMAETNRYTNLIVLYSLTKFFAIPGLRLGTMVAHPDFIKEADLRRDPWNINVFAQLAGEVALQDREYIQETLDFFVSEKLFLFEQLQLIKNIKAFQPSANYIFIKLLAFYTSTAICEQLAQQGILVRNLNSYPLLGENYLRVAIKTREENLLLVQNLQKILGEKIND